VLLNFEKSTLTAVIEASSKGYVSKIDPANITTEQFAEFNKAQSGVSSSLSRLLVTEAYPDLKANQNFLNFRTNWRVQKIKF
jgi:LemA protein